MNKMLLATTLATSAFSAQAQIIGRPIKEYTTRKGTTLHVGDTLKFARGLREDGSFKYAAIPVQALHSTETSLPSSWNYRKAPISSLREIPYKTGRVVTAVFKTGTLHATLSPDAAEESGEIITAANQHGPIPAGGVADELLKLKKLLDAGAITQAEFDSQKAKLLAH